MPAEEELPKRIRETYSVPAHLWKYAQDQDRLVLAASELRAYLLELAQSASITVHAVDSRAKSLASYEEKSKRLDHAGAPKYSDPATQIQDCIAARVIVFTTRAREDLLQILQNRLVVIEKRNPGLEKFNGYDSEHLIVTGVRDAGVSTRLPALAGYLSTYAGLEIQLRSVASHAWAEYEHDVRYKGGAYEELAANDKDQIDQWFIEAGGMRRVMDSLFALIEERLAPAMPITHPATGSAQASRTKQIDDRSNTPDSFTNQPTQRDDAVEGTNADDELSAADHEIEGGEPTYNGTPLSLETLESFATARFPENKPSDRNELETLLAHLQKLGIEHVENLESALGDVDEQKVARLMDYQGNVSGVRRLDDLLLAIFEEKYIETAEEAEFADLLRLRLRRVRGNFAIYTIRGARIETKPLTAAGALRRVAAVVAAFAERPEVEIPGVVAWNRSDLKGSARTTIVKTKKGELWVATNITRADAEEVMRKLVSRLPSNLNLQILRAGDVLVDGSSA